MSENRRKYRLFPYILKEKQFVFIDLKTLGAFLMRWGDMG